MSLENLNGRLREIVDELVHHGLTLEQARQEFEKQFIVSSLEANDYNVGRSARSLGIHRNTLRNKTTGLDIDVEALRSAHREARRSGSGS
jgi:DNA-binding NtrC family response regulator